LLPTISKLPHQPPRLHKNRKMLLTGEPRGTASVSSERAATPVDGASAAEALKRGPRGALALASIAVGLLFIGWLAFYFLLFLPRGSIG
jgi:hypothetical protein